MWLIDLNVWLKSSLVGQIEVPVRAEEGCFTKLNNVFERV